MWPRSHSGGLMSSRVSAHGGAEDAAASVSARKHASDAPTPALSVFDAVMITVGIVIGAGVFQTPTLVADIAGSPMLMLAAWLLGLGNLLMLAALPLASPWPLAVGLLCNLLAGLLYHRQPPRIVEVEIPLPAAAPEPAPFASHVQHASAGLRSDAVVQLHTPVSHPAWRDEAAERMASLVTRGVERAELRLSPAELGPVEVRIDVRGSEATLAIVAAQPATRDALEQALPALRDLLSQQGLSLGEATVRDGRTDGQPSQERGGEAGSRFDDRTSAPRDEEAPIVRRSVRLVDTFA